MSPNLPHLASRYRFNEHFLGIVTAGFTEAHWSTSPGGGANTAHWVLGHIANTRRLFARRLGAELPEEPWEPHFGRGAKPTGTEGFPPPSALIEDFAMTGALIKERLESMTEAEGAEPFGNKFPDGSETMADGAAFLHFHETYHLGQLGLARSIAGLPGFA